MPICPPRQPLTVKASCSRWLRSFTASYDGAEYLFVSAANRDTFVSEPAEFAPAYGGFCAMGAALGKRLDGDRSSGGSSMARSIATSPRRRRNAGSRTCAFSPSSGSGSARARARSASRCRESRFGFFKFRT